MSFDFMEAVGVLIILLHAVVIGSIILWFMAGKPTSYQRFRSGLRTDLKRNLRILFSFTPQDEPRRR